MNNILILGGGISGQGVYLTATKLGINAYIYDDKKDCVMPDIIQYDLVVISPSIPLDHPAIVQARSHGIEIIGEIEWGYRLCKSDIIAITGTNGKTTTARLIVRMIECAGKDVAIAGNIGKAFCSVVLDKHDVVVLEVSSFQLLSIDRFCPHIAIITNITPDHLDVHKTMNNYVSTKLSIARNQSINDYVVLGMDDIDIAYIKDFSPKSQVIKCSTESGNKVRTPEPSGAHCKRALLVENMGDINELNDVYCRRHNITDEHRQRAMPAYSMIRGAYIVEQSVYCGDEYICEIRDITIKGKGNLCNALNAICAAKLYGIPNTAIVEALREYRGERHRMEYVRTLNGITYINDSKSTNLAASFKAIDSVEGRIALILGGYDKGNDYSILFDKIPSKVVCVYAYGQASQSIQMSAHLCNYRHTVAANSIEQAVQLASQQVVDIVLLSPGTSSFDMYKDYEDRGNDFVRIVESL